MKIKYQAQFLIIIISTFQLHSQNQSQLSVGLFQEHQLFKTLLQTTIQVKINLVKIIKIRMTQDLALWLQDQTMTKKMIRNISEHLQSFQVDKF